MVQKEEEIVQVSGQEELLKTLCSASVTEATRYAVRQSTTAGASVIFGGGGGDSELRQITAVGFRG